MNTDFEPLAAKVALKEAQLHAWNLLVEWLAEDEARRLKVVNDDVEGLMLVVFCEDDSITTGDVLQVAMALDLPVFTQELAALTRIQLEKMDDEEVELDS
jgi:hypothetical protein